MIINSPQELYQLVKDLKMSDQIVTHFMGIMYLYIHGCTCDATKNWDSAVIIYKTMKDADLSELKNEKKCDKIKFFLDNEFLFEV